MKTDLTRVGVPKVISTTISGKYDICKEYVLYIKLKKKYINEIESNIKFYAKKLTKNKDFSNVLARNIDLLEIIFRYIEKHFDIYDFKKILSRDLTHDQFIIDVCEIRKNKRNDIKK